MNLAIANVVFYVFTCIIGGQIFYTGTRAIVYFGFSVHNFLAGLFWTPLTAIFTHGGVVHIMSNMIFLFVYGFRLEERDYTAKGIYFAYIFTGILSTILSGPLIGVNVISVGASGAIFGLLGVNAGIERREMTGNYRPMILGAVVLFFLTSSSPNTNIFAHLFGLILGFFLGNSSYFGKYKFLGVKNLDTKQFQ